MISKSVILRISTMLFLTICFSVASAQSEDKNANFEFARELFNQNDYFRSITEAKRFIFTNPDSPFVIDAFLLIADAYAGGGDLQEALKHYQSYLVKYPSAIEVPKVLIKIGGLYADNQNYVEAIKYFEKARKHPSSTSGLSKKATNWIFMLVLLSENDIEASSILNDAGNEADRKQLLMFQEEYNNIPFKSPSTAGTLAAIIPGAGHMYLGRNRDAFASFLLNSLFIWGIIESFKQDNIAVGATLSVFEIGWYGGNIYSAINSAHKYNRKLKNNFKLKFKIDTGLMSNSFKNTNKLFLVFNANF